MVAVTKQIIVGNPIVHGIPSGYSVGNEAQPLTEQRDTSGFL